MAWNARLCVFASLSSRPRRAAGVVPPVVASGLVDAYPVPYSSPRLRVRTDHVGALLGVELQDDEIGQLLEPLGFVTDIAADADSAGVLEVTVPSFRPDVRREVDVTEEVARRIGYQQLPVTERRSPFVGRLSQLQSLRRKLRRVMAGLGAHEAWTVSIVEPRHQERGGVVSPLVRLLNPMVAEESALRGGLLPGLLGTLAHNLGA